MTTKVQIECDGWTDGCKTYLNIEYPDDVPGDMRSNGWHESETVCNEHYCPVCWETYKEENPGVED